MRRISLLAVGLWLAAGATVAAQVIPPSEQPGRERQRFAEPPTPLAEPIGPRIALPSTVAPAGADKIRLTIRGIRVEGATVYRPDELRLLYQDLIGPEVTLQAVYDIAQRITGKYGADGYVLSRAIVPPQSLSRHGAVIQIKVIEGYVDKVVWPETLSRYRDYFTHYAAQITAQRPANVRNIERYLLLAGELPGLKFSTSLKASKKNPNAATLLVESTYRPVEAIARVDNRGTPARGPIQYLGSVTANNVFGQQDSLNVTYAGILPDNKELNYFAAGYRQVLNGEGLAALINASYGFGKPGTAELELLNFKTKTLYADGGLSFPAIRSREKNLIFTGLFFASDSTSDLFGAPNNLDRMRGFRVKADADLADPWQGINQLNVTLSQGVRGLGDTGNPNPNVPRPDGTSPSTPDGRVDFTKIEATLSRLQPLYGPVSAFLSAYGQYAGTSLLTPERCSFGGRFFGRAFDPSQLLGDDCVMGSAELRYDLPAVWQISQAQFYGFADAAELHNRVPDFIGALTSFHAASAGAGLRLGWLGYLNADLTIAKAIDGPRDDTRFFFGVTGKY